MNLVLLDHAHPDGSGGFTQGLPCLFIAEGAPVSLIPTNPAHMESQTLREVRTTHVTIIVGITTLIADIWILLQNPLDFCLLGFPGPLLLPFALITLGWEGWFVQLHGSQLQLHNLESP